MLKINCLKLHSHLPFEEVHRAPWSIYFLNINMCRPSCISWYINLDKPKDNSDSVINIAINIIDQTNGKSDWKTFLIHLSDLIEIRYINTFKPQAHSW